jgi:hypothetical protein
MNHSPGEFPFMSSMAAIHNLNTCVDFACQRCSGVGIPAGNHARIWRIPFIIRSNETQVGKEVKPSGSGRSNSRLGRQASRMTEDSNEGFVYFSVAILLNSKGCRRGELRKRNFEGNLESSYSAR